MFNQPDMFREMEYALKVTRGLYTDYFPPKEIFKMATSNAGQFINNKLGILDEGYLADLIVVEQQSVDPILSLINRSQSKNIKTVMTDGTIIYQR
jgi:cytosine/adenosine deaminase-related metal-dependent hydrolase